MLPQTKTVSPCMYHCKATGESKEEQWLWLVSELLHACMFVDRQWQRSVLDVYNITCFHCCYTWNAFCSAHLKGELPWKHNLPSTDRSQKDKSNGASCFFKIGSVTQIWQWYSADNIGEWEIISSYIRTPVSPAHFLNFIISANIISL